MSPFREQSYPFPRRRSDSDHPDIYDHGGRIELSHYAENEWPFLFQEFSTHLERWSEKGQSDLFEQFLTLEVPTPAQAEEVINHFDHEQRCELATSLAFQTQTLKYAHLFHLLWSDLPAEYKDKPPPDMEWDDQSIEWKRRMWQERGQIVLGSLTKFVQQHPERAILIAPFTDLTRVIQPIDDLPEALLPSERPHEQRARLLRSRDKQPDFKKSTDRRKPLKDWLVEHRDDNSKEKSLFETAFSSPDSVTQLLDTYRDLAVERTIFPRRDYFLQYVETIKKSCPQLLCPYLVDFINAGDLSQTEAQAILPEAQKMMDLNFFTSNNQREQRKRLEQELKRRHPGGQDWDLDYFSDHPSFDLKWHAEQLKNQAKKRCVNMMSADPRVFTELLPAPERINFFMECLRNGTPIFAASANFQLTAEEVQTILSKCRAEGEMAFLLSDGSEILSLLNQGYESMVMQHLFFKLNEDFDHIDITRVVAGILNYIDLLSPKMRQRWIDQITKKSPHLWLDHFDAFFKLKVLSFRALIERIGAADPEQLIHHASHIFALIQKNKRQGQTLDLDEEAFKAILRKMLINNAALFIESPAWIRDLLPPEKTTECINKLLEPSTDPLLVSIFLEKIKNFQFIPDLASRLHQNFLKNPKLFGEVMNISSAVWDEVVTLFGLPACRDLVVASTLYIDFTKTIIFKFIQDLTDPATLRCILYILQNQNPDHLVEFLAELEDFEKFKRIEIAHASSLRAIAAAKQTIQTRCERERFAIFRNGMIDVLGSTIASPLIERDLPEYLETHPAALANPSITKTLSDDRYELLIQSHRIFYATQLDRYGGPFFEEAKLSPELTEELAKESILFGMKRKGELGKDYYDVLHDWVETLPFGRLILKELERISKGQRERYGKQTDASSITLPGELTSLIQRIDLLRSNPLLVGREQELLALPPKQAEAFLSIAETCLLYDLVDEAHPDFWSGDLTDLQGDLTLRLTKFLAKIFNLPHLEDVRTLPVSPKMIKDLMTYHQKSSEKKPGIQASLRQFVEKLFSGVYDPWRAWGVDEIPSSPEQKSEALVGLKKQGLLPEGLRLDQYEAWVQDEEMNFEETLDYSSEDLKYIVRKILHQATEDGHIDAKKIPTDSSAVKAEYDELFEPLQVWTAEIAGLEAEYRAHRASLKDAATNGGEASQPFDVVKRARFEELKKRVRGYQERNQELMTSVTARLYLAHLREITLDELEQQRIRIGKKQVALDHVFKKCTAFFEERAPEFLSDLHRIQKELLEARRHLFQSEGRVSKSKLTVRDKVDADVYFHIGSEPVESCQHFDQGFLNEGLLAYVVDPNVRILQIRNEEGEMITRAVLRLLETEHGEPALFLERIYSINNNPKIDEAIKKLAFKKAASMEVKLYSKEVSGKIDLEDFETVMLKSRGSRHPFVYTDAGGNLRSNGEYAIGTALPLAA